MTVTIELSGEVHSRVKAKAAELGLKAAEYLRSVIERDADDTTETTGQRLLDGWESEGVLGLFEDRPDSPEFAEELRRRANLRA